MREAVQYLRAAAEAVDRAAVVLLIQEESGLLAVFNIHDIADAVLGDLYFGIEGSGKEPFLPGHALKLADFGVAALVNAAHRNAVFGIQRRECPHICLPSGPAGNQLLRTEDGSWKCR